MGKSPKKPQGKFVINDICPLNTIWNLFDKMFVVPKHIRSKALLINKIMPLFNMSDFSHPPKWDSENGGENILYDLPRKHLAIST